MGPEAFRTSGTRPDGSPAIERVTAALADREEVAEVAGVPERGIVWIRVAFAGCRLADDAEGKQHDVAQDEQ
jgi:hypothetical protein